MAEWLLEDGIGEQRAVLLQGDRILAARLHWPDGLVAGQVEDAILVSRISGSARGTARFTSGEEALVDRLPREASEGASIRLEIARAAIGERDRLKLAHARPSEKEVATPGLGDSLRAEGHEVRAVQRFPACGWDELVTEALEKRLDFAGGSLLFAPTPAMMVIDIDGTLPARALALAVVAPLADAIQRFDLGGMIGVDFPTLETKADRRAVDESLSEALTDWPHERTAMNGFGFVQLVARLERPSLLHRATTARTGLVARRLLRQAEKVTEPGALLLTMHPALKPKLKPEWLEDLARRTGRELRIETDPGLALESGFAQAVPL